MFYPMMVDIVDKKILIIGGGSVAHRKARNFLDFGGSVLVVSPEFNDGFCELAKEYEDNLTLIEDCYHEKYVESSFLVVAATSSREVNEQVRAYCDDNDILCNVIDSLEGSSYICPSIVNRDGLIVSVSTMGQCPYLCKKIREEIEDSYSKYDGEYMKLLGEVRKTIIEKHSDRKEELLDYCIGLSKDELDKMNKDLAKTPE